MYIRTSVCTVPGIVETSIRTTRLSFARHWLEATQGAPTHCQVPPAASVITTPLVPSVCNTMFISHTHRALVHFFLHGITTGFHIGYNLPSAALKSAKKIMPSACDHAAVESDYLTAELAEGRIAGPFSPSMVPYAHISRVGVIPKSHQPNKWRLIVDLSNPHGNSVNNSVQRIYAPLLKCRWMMPQVTSSKLVQELSSQKSISKVHSVLSQYTQRSPPSSDGVGGLTFYRHLPSVWLAVSPEIVF